METTAHVLQFRIAFSLSNTKLFLDCDMSYGSIWHYAEHMKIHVQFKICQPTAVLFMYYCTLLYVILTAGGLLVGSSVWSCVYTCIKARIQILQADNTSFNCCMLFCLYQAKDNWWQGFSSEANMVTQTLRAISDNPMNNKRWMALADFWLGF